MTKVIIVHENRVEVLTEEELDRLKMILCSAEEFDDDSGEDELATQVAAMAEKFYPTEENSEN